MVSLDDLLAECFDNDGSAAAAQSARTSHRAAPVPTAAPSHLHVSLPIVTAAGW